MKFQNSPKAALIAHSPEQNSFSDTRSNNIKIDKNIPDKKRFINGGANLVAHGAMAGHKRWMDMSLGKLWINLHVRGQKDSRTATKYQLFMILFISEPCYLCCYFNNSEWFERGRKLRFQYMWILNCILKHKNEWINYQNLYTYHLRTKKYYQTGK